MDFIELMKVLGFAVSAFIVYRLMVREKKDKTKGHYTRPAWNFFLKKIYAEYKVKQKQKQDKKRMITDTRHESEAPKILPNEESSDSQMICGYDSTGNSLLIKFTRLRHGVAEIWLMIRLKNGDVYTLPDHPNTKVVNATPRIFEGSGLKLECIIPYAKWRFTFSGLLRRGVAQNVSESDDDLFFVRFNFIWATASDPTFWPLELSPKLIATSLATERWRDGKWMELLIKKDSGGYDQYGSCLGQVKVFEKDCSSYVEGLSPKVETFEMNLPGIKQRRWGPHKNHHLHRTGVLIASAKDGCVFEVGAFSGKYGLTHTQFGNFRFPDGRVVSIDQTDFNLAALGEYQNNLPQATIVQLEAADKKFIVVVTFKNKEKLPLYGGSRKESWNAFVIPIEIKINTVVGYGAAIFWYPLNLREFDIQEIPTKIKRIFNRTNGPSPSKLLLSFADKDAQSVLVSGGKGSSLAILRVIQETKGADFLDKRNRSHQILNALVDQVSANPLKRSMKVQSLLSADSTRESRRRAGSVAKMIFPDPNDFDVPDYLVPQGFIVSVSAIDEHLTINPSIMSRLIELEDIAYERSAGDIQEACKNVQKSFESTKLSESLKEKIAEKLIQINFDSSARFAVRSSGVTEDSEESSAAGQNETFLGLRKNEDVFDSVVKCWASLYSFQSVQYRKQHVQPVITSMAVVIQKMVAAESAGVLFSRHPLNGDPSVIVITANYGLGESVVSAKSEPDTFLVKRSYKDELEILGSKAGAKKLLIEMDDDTSIKEIELNDEKRKQLCLSEDVVLKLAKLGVIMEKFFGTPRDIEFAVTGDKKIYLLQSRPITALNNFTDYEIIHENDTPVMSDFDIATKANIGEVFQGSATVLTQSVITKTFDQLVYKDMGIPGDYSGLYTRFFPVNRHHILMAVNSVFLANIGTKIGINERVTAMSVFGSDIYEKYDNLLEIAHHRNSLRGKKTLSLLGLAYSAIFKIKEHMRVLDETCEKVHRQFSLESIEKLTNSKDVLSLIERGIVDIRTASLCHTRASNNSIFFQMFAFAALTSKAEKLTIQHQGDIASILGSIGNVESANVPQMIKEIAGRIMLEMHREEFLKVDKKEAVEWLKQNCSSAHELLKGFIKRHGHRALNEFDFATKPWGMEPETIIDMIKSNLSIAADMSGTPSYIKTNDDIIEELKTPLGNIAKFILKKLLPKCQQGVQTREYAKSKLILVISEIRRAVNYLGQMMVYEGLLPGKDLVCHLSPSEIKDLIATRDGKFVMKAIRRQKLFPKLYELRFDELSFGVPVPLSEQEKSKPEVYDGDILVKGMPVCGGVVTAKACICKSFADVVKLEKGDILITYGTDIGWSPYFPILSGICTEIGGLISHGAVVAREYGLPCIVGASSATDRVQHGQMITLNADEGIISAVL